MEKGFSYHPLDPTTHGPFPNVHRTYCAAGKNGRKKDNIHVLAVGASWTLLTLLRSVPSYYWPCDLGFDLSHLKDSCPQWQHQKYFREKNKTPTRLPHFLLSLLSLMLLQHLTTQHLVTKDNMEERTCGFSRWQSKANALVLNIHRSQNVFHLSSVICP